MHDDIQSHQKNIPAGFICGTTLKKFGDICRPENISRLAFILGTSDDKIFFLKQIHSDIIVDIDDGYRKLSEGDGLYTERKDLVLLIKTADCYPVIVTDSLRQKILLLHVGRAGAMKDFVSKGIRHILKAGGGSEELNVFIGPGICQKCYGFDLKSAILDQVRLGGIKDDKIKIHDECTKCFVQKYFSHRNKDIERMGTFMAIKNIC